MHDMLQSVQTSGLDKEAHQIRMQQTATVHLPNMQQEVHPETQPETPPAKRACDMTILICMLYVITNKIGRNVFFLFVFTLFGSH